MATIRWVCGSCRRPVNGCEGYVGASLRQVRERVPVTWFVAHDRCRPDDDAYWIDVEDVADDDGVAWWTRHLSEKNWWNQDSWAAVLASAIRSVPDREPAPWTPGGFPDAAWDVS